MKDGWGKGETIGGREEEKGMGGEKEEMKGEADGGEERGDTACCNKVTFASTSSKAQASSKYGSTDLGIKGSGSSLRYFFSRSPTLFISHHCQMKTDNLKIDCE